ncbi:MAG: hypothetical protein KJ947_02910 [Alphaproteobacteria bacterium]|jgi:hypothetical protein|nr:hypothetical protein [Alphaproteobacteria bacterium]MBU1548512.1 hypothetical protein [Alphaproteobacteria bacterium]MBU2337708.1 hypothetical protein [Alphaproteobacteria bacterium]MBU2389845.1 hypothetical protein [Alphaproteobacteria bacterium]|tara:strand:- start:756 stop:974 length:219 start_codon:yes stop_codon:yes gene_type:complete
MTCREHGRQCFFGLGEPLLVHRPQENDDVTFDHSAHDHYLVASLFHGVAVHFGSAGLVLSFSMIAGHYAVSL